MKETLKSEECPYLLIQAEQKQTHEGLIFIKMTDTHVWY